MGLIEACVEVAEGVGVGRHVVTKRRVARGTLVAVDDDFAFGLEADQQLLRCGLCGVRPAATTSRVGGGQGPPLRQHAVLVPQGDEGDVVDPSHWAAGRRLLASSAGQRSRIHLDGVGRLYGRRRRRRRRSWRRLLTKRTRAGKLEP